MDFSELQNAVFQELGEDSASPAFWTVDDVKTALNDGYAEIADYAECCENTYDITMTSFDRYAQLYATVQFPPGVPLIFTPQILQITKAYNNDTRLWLQPTTVKSLDATDPNWELASGAPTLYLLRGTYFFGVWPFPNSNTSITLYTLEVPHGAGYNDLPLMLDADTPTFPADYHRALVWYAVYELLCQDAEYKKAMVYYEQYLALADALRKWTSNRASNPMQRVIGGGGLWT